MIKLLEIDMTDEEILEVVNTLKSGILVQDKKVELFERKLCEYLNVNYVVAVSSGTAALHLTMLALDIGIDDEIIIPDFTFPAAANVVELVGAKPIFTDINLHNYCINVDDIERKINSKTKAVIVVHQFGNIADVDEIISLQRKYGFIFIEDAACALGSSYNGIKPGSFGDVACFSLHPRKIITTGEGGFIATNNSDIAMKLRMLRNHGFVYGSANVRDLLYPGLNYRMTEYQAAMGLAQLSKIDKIINVRRRFAEMYSSLLNELVGNEIEYIHIESDKKFNNYQSYFIVLNDKFDRNSLIQYMYDNGIQTSIGAYSIHRLNYYFKKYRYDSIEFKNSLKCSNKGIVLPLHTNLSEEDVFRVVQVLKVYFK